MITVDDSGVTAGVASIDAKIDAAAKISSDMSPLWPRVGQLFAEHQRDVFASGHNWQPLEQSTIMKKRSAQVLVQSGRLMAAATSATPVESNPLFATFGLTHAQVPYAHWHARGAGVPRRDPVPAMPPTVIRSILDMVQERMRGALA
jgi:phage gpG-like protein